LKQHDTHIRLLPTFWLLLFLEEKISPNLAHNPLIRFLEFSTTEIVILNIIFFQ